MGNCACVRPSKPSQFEIKLAKCRDSGRRYVDVEFPPSKESLIPDWSDDDPEVYWKMEEWALFEWKRIWDIFDENQMLEIFSDKIEPADILQGALDDSYFLCVLSVLAENPERIRRLFVS